jgi:hypothetical protein
MGPWELYDDMEIHRPMPMVPRILAELQDWKKKWV